MLASRIRSVTSGLSLPTSETSRHNENRHFENEKEGDAIMSVKPIPEGYHTATPYLIIKGASDAIEFYKKVFGASEVMRFPAPGGRVGHAEIKIGDSYLMMADEHPEMGYVGPKTLGGTSVSLMLYVPDADATFNKAVGAGATVEKGMQDQFYGDRSGTLVDPWGHRWTVATHKEDVSPEEMQRRMAAMQAAK
jgi:PhnB protein